VSRRKQPGGVAAARTITDAQVVDAVRQAAWTTEAHGPRVLAPEGLYGRRKMTALNRRSLPDAAAGRGWTVPMRTLGLQGLRRVTKVRTTVPAADGKRAGDLLDRDFTAPAPPTQVGHRLHLCADLGGVRLRSSSM
jgi:putative transposase